MQRNKYTEHDEQTRRQFAILKRGMEEAARRNMPDDKTLRAMEDRLIARMRQRYGEKEDNKTRFLDWLFGHAWQLSGALAVSVLVGVMVWPMLIDQLVPTPPDPGYKGPDIGIVTRYTLPLLPESERPSLRSALEAAGATVELQSDGDWLIQAQDWKPVEVVLTPYGIRDLSGTHIKIGFK